MPRPIVINNIDQFNGKLKENTEFNELDGEQVSNDQLKEAFNGLSSDQRMVETGKNKFSILNRMTE